MSEVLNFGTVVLAAAAGLSLALLASKLTTRVPVPGPAVFLAAAATASALAPSVREHLSIRSVERIGVVALIVILFHGGAQIGWRRFRAALVPIGALGVVGTFATAGGVALAARGLLGFDWQTAGLLGAAIAPTDPAVMFSVLGNREIRGRAGTILEGESGANDPVGIALMIGLLELATTDHGSLWSVLVEFSAAMVVGLVAGVVGARLFAVVTRISLPDPSVYPLTALAFAGVIYGVATVAHGSGFLAVFVAGVLVAERDLPHRVSVERFHSTLASLAEIVMFVALGLTVDVTDFGSAWTDGLVLAAAATFVVRPLVAGALLTPLRVDRAARLFVIWGGLKGAVPILLGALAILNGADDAEQIYDVVFVVVMFSVVVQGTTVPFVADRLGLAVGRAEARKAQPA